MTRKHPFNSSNSRISIPSIFASVALLSIALFSCSLSGLAPKTPANRYALVIGVQDYPNSAHVDNDLSYPDDDASDLATLLASSGWTVKKQLISTSDGSIATDGSPTYANIKAAIDSLSTDDSATILVYYSGHGSTDNGTPYIIPYDGLTTTETPYSYYGQTYYYQNDDLAKWITPATLRSWMEAVPAKNRVLILDSCYSGGFITGANAVDTAPDDYCQKYGTTADTAILLAALSNFNTLVANNLAAQGTRDIVALSAAGSGEVSWDDLGVSNGRSNNGVFTNYLLKAAESGDVDSDGYVTVAEAYSYAKKNVKANWNADFWNYIDAYGDYSFDFLPHISGGTGDIALYAPGG